ncbi:MAG: type II toxin-antitoxin system PemK/MazF family toxin [Deltaproteobacteria bacterium]|nr:type II toxin-antitoxin system PemK/MazF family toxin [Deltaproteobacteria bacterium]
MNRGEIWFFEFKKPDKPRPVLILTRQETLPYLNTVTIAPITRTIRGVPSEIMLGPKEGLKEPCVANLHHLNTVSKADLKKFVGSLSDEKMNELKEALLFALGFND